MNNTLRIMQWSKGSLSWEQACKLPCSVRDQALEMLEQDNKTPGTDLDD